MASSSPPSTSLVQPALWLQPLGPIQRGSFAVAPLSLRPCVTQLTGTRNRALSLPSGGSLQHRREARGSEAFRRLHMGLICDETPSFPPLTLPWIDSS